MQPFVLWLLLFEACRQLQHALRYAASLQVEPPPEAEILSPRSSGSVGKGDIDDASIDPVSIVKSVVGQVKKHYKERKDRERALSTVTHLPDDVAWKQDEIFSDSDRDESGSNGSVTERQAASPSPKTGKRWSAEEQSQAPAAKVWSCGRFIVR
jgi:hypothetical protein